MSPFVFIFYFWLYVGIWKLPSLGLAGWLENINCKLRINRTGPMWKIIGDIESRFLEWNIHLAVTRRPLFPLFRGRPSNISRLWGAPHEEARQAGWEVVQLTHADDDCIRWTRRCHHTPLKKNLPVLIGTTTMTILHIRRDDHRCWSWNYQ